MHMCKLARLCIGFLPWPKFECVLGRVRDCEIVECVCLRVGCVRVNRLPPLIKCPDNGADAGAQSDGLYLPEAPEMTRMTAYDALGWEF